MSCLNSILKTLESIKKKYPAFKIKVASVQLEYINDSEHEQLVEILSTYDVAQLIIGNTDIKGVP